MHIGEQIKRARRMKNLTQQELADKIHKTRPLISSIEQTGKVNIYTLKQICEVLDINFDNPEMLTGELSVDYSSKKVIELQRELEKVTSERDSLRLQLAESQKQLADSQNKIIEMLQEKLSNKGRKTK